MSQPLPDRSADASADPSADPSVVTDAATSRDAMAVSDAASPKLAFPVVGIGASAGGLEAFIEFFDAMPSDRGLAFVLVQHLSPKHESVIAEILQKHTAMPVHQVDDGMKVERDHVYVIRPGHTMTIKDGRLRLGDSLLKPGHSRPVDDFFRSLAEEQRERAICVILSGMGSNGTAGAQAVKVVGGMGLAQEPGTAKFPSMPRSMIDANAADFILGPAEMPEVLLRYAGHAYVRNEQPAELLARAEGQHVTDIVAILRTRLRHDFSGYKRPTIVRRIQRRMSLTQNISMADYARVLRQTPTEVQNLSDDLMIHVTGFFRDPAVWEALRERVILPMVAEKPDQAVIRVWVTACASGEEAYTLAMLLVEAAEQVGKHFDIKVFATDMAERMLNHARGGIYAGGIESEISPERLARFFDKDESMYRVNKYLRELVVFAPQNVLQDPPFSRLDIITCRNLMIYLEPEIQQRLLSLLHFGLREGGVLVLGNSETIGHEGGLFEPIDKKLRVYRRVGATRHGMANFPARRLSAAAGGAAAEADVSLSRASLAQATAKTLLEHQSPPSLVVDRRGRIVYFHGDTRLFLGQPSGEPTREVLELALEFVRGSLRVALHNAVETGQPAMSKDGVLNIDDAPFRVEVHVVPLEHRSLQGYYLVSFVHYPASQLPRQPDADGEDADGPLHDELRTLRDELQSTIEELQTSNEEMKASNEEVTSINEEIQSTNEELETSKEELQSLNEELTTVNAQLQTKMEELERTGNDLESLLGSTEIAVIFLDLQFRIRRFTPAVKRLMDLIPGDAGRPLADMARRFDDPRLLDDARTVLRTLQPMEAEITGGDGRGYTRRILPYRTGDNRIDGTVLTFVDVTERRAAEQKVRQSDNRLRTLLTAGTEALYRMSPDWGTMFVLEGNNFLSDTSKSNRSWLDRYIPVPERPAVMAAIRQAIERRTTFEFEHRVRREDGSIGWTFSRAVPILDDAGEIAEWFGIATDITARKQAEQVLLDNAERQTFLLRLSDALRPLADAAGIKAVAARLLGEHLGVDRVAYAELLPDGQSMVTEGGWLREGVPSVDGVYRAAEFGAFFERNDQGLTAVIEDADSGTAARATRDALARVGVRAAIAHPLVKQGRLVAVFYVHSVEPRPWSESDVALVTELGERTWAAVERGRAEATLRESETRYVALAANLPHGAAFVIDKDLRYVLAEGQALGDAGLTPAHFVGRTVAEALPPETSAAYAAHYRAALAGETFRHEHTADGRTFATHGGPLRDAAGRVYAAMAVSYDITERKRAEADRATLLEAEQHARTAAESANATKDQFLANLSHELRTPLAAMLIWSNVLRDQADPATLSEGLAAIEQSAKAQQKLIDDLLDSARIAVGKMRLEIRPVDLGQVIRDAVTTLRPTADAKRVTLKADTDKTVGVVMADGDRLRQVVWNLISNALKFTPAGGRVGVSVSRREGSVEIAVADTGLGMDADLLPQIFGRFQQADPSRTRRHSGLGLGLSISRQIVELHGGTIEATSDGVGRGSLFTVSLPLRPTRSDARPPTDTHALQGVRIVLVEDDATLRDVVTMVLQRAGARVDTFGMADPARAALLADPPDLLLCDIGLPDKDGCTMIREFREQERVPGTLPAIAFTAFDRPQDRAHALECGFDAHLAKPADPNHLVKTVQAVLRQSSQ